ncbi:MAG: hypothetical protein DMD63_02530 [Gemmatimonadetes bacterium]|nr:MAG: hypothetical protein DMD63_02530 [Gemmatimonadota bacterium]
MANATPRSRFSSLTIVTVVMMESPLRCTAPSNRIAVAGSPGPTWHATTQTDPSAMSALTLASLIFVRESTRRETRSTLPPPAQATRPASLLGDRAVLHH